MSYIQIAPAIHLVKKTFEARLGGQSELGAVAASRKAVWWDLHLASLLTHLLEHSFLVRCRSGRHLRMLYCPLKWDVN